MSRRNVVAVLGGSAAFVLALALLQLFDKQVLEISQLRAASAKTEERLKKNADIMTEYEERNAALASESAALRAKLESGEAESELRAREKAVPGGAETVGDKESSAAIMESVADDLEKLTSDSGTARGFASYCAFTLRPYYADLVKSLHLGPEEAIILYDLLGVRQIARAENGARFIRNQDSAGPAELARLVDLHLKELLGEEGLSAFQHYEKNLPDRVQVQQLNQQLAASGVPLNSGQQEALLKILIEERIRTPSEFGGNSPLALPKVENYDEASLRQIIQLQGEMDERVRLRAMSVLNSEQLGIYEVIQKQSLELARSTLELSRKIVTH